jgi:hypothetical protein
LPERWRRARFRSAPSAPDTQRSRASVGCYRGAVVLRARHLLAAAAIGVAVRVVIACSTSGTPAVAEVEAGPPGEAFTACQIQGYASETDSGGCPVGTCPVLAFDTNGGLLPCCTSIVSGPGRCIDGGMPVLVDASDDADADDAAETAEAVDSSEDAETGADAAPDGDSATPESGLPSDAGEAG